MKKTSSSQKAVVDRTPDYKWLRYPQLPFGRTLATKLADEGYLFSVIVKSPGSKRGVRLFSAESLDRYLRSLAEPKKEGAK